MRRLLFIALGALLFIGYLFAASNCAIPYC